MYIEVHTELGDDNKITSFIHSFIHSYSFTKS